MAMDHTYKVIELVGSSSEGLQPAIETAVARAAQTIRALYSLLKERAGGAK